MTRTTTREPTKRVRDAKKMKQSSAAWLTRHINDPYVHEAQRLGYRSRAAFKLLQLDEKLHLLKPNMRVVDLGAAPGGWSQILATRHLKQVVAIDILPMDELPGVDFLCMDFTADEAPDALKEKLGGNLVDIVLSDLAPNTTGHKATDHLRLMALLDLAAAFAVEVLAPNGTFVAKVFQGGTENTLLAELKKQFKVVKHVKPAASRAESSETYVCALGFRGRDNG